MASFLTGDYDDYSGMIYGDYHPETLAFLRNSPQQFSARLSEAGQRFIAASEQILGSFNIDEVARKMRAAGRQVAAAFQSDVIRELNTIGELQNPPPSMRHLIMAEPTVRRYYFNQVIDGYSGDYVDVEPGQIKHDHYDYRRVMDGIVSLNADGDFEVHQYFEEVRAEDHLEFDQQVEVVLTWQQIKAKLLEGRDDPTSKWNAAL